MLCPVKVDLIWPLENPRVAVGGWKHDRDRISGSNFLGSKLNRTGCGSCESYIWGVEPKHLFDGFGNEVWVLPQLMLKILMSGKMQHRAGQDKGRCAVSSHDDLPQAAGDQLSVEWPELIVY